MLQEWFNKIFYGRVKWLIYILSLLLIYYLDKYDFKIVIGVSKFIIIISIIWIINIILRKHYMHYIIYINTIINTNYPIIIKLRREFINLPFILRIILSLIIFIDMFLIKILYLETRKKNKFYFIRLLIYYNILIWVSLPFHLISELYEIILRFINKVDILNYFYLRLNFLFLSIVFILLLDIKRIDFIILIWILDTIITLYYYWVINFLKFKSFKWNDWKENNYLLYTAFFNTGGDYNDLANHLIYLEDERTKIILFLKDSNFIKDEKTLYKKFWNKYYIKFQQNKQILFDFYSFDNEEEFFLSFFNKLYENAEK